MNNELKEKEMIRGYHLERMIIYLLGVGFTPFIACGFFAFGAFCHDLIWLNESNGAALGVVIGLVIFFVAMGLAIYHSTKYLKSYKECQELANLTLTSEIATESEAERERERRKKK